MSNLKKITALSLAAASLLSTVASADFIDAADIDAKVAVDTLTALGIINGRDDGTFDPEGTVTRAEMAKMIFTIKNGGNDDGSGFADLPSSFTDIDGHWAEGYIKYCQSQGIIAGKSATTFDPNANVTGAEAFKMALATLGYDAEKAGLTGPEWYNNTVTLSIDKSLNDDYMQAYGEDAERQSAAQILYNALFANVVRWSNDYQDFEFIYDSSNDALTLGERSLDLATEEDVFLANVQKEEGIEFLNDPSAYVGQMVDILYDDEKNEAYGVTSVADLVETKMSSNDAIDGSKLDTGDLSIAIDDLDNVDVFIDGVQYTGSKTVETELSQYADYSVTLIDNTGNGKVDAASFVTATVKRVTTINDDKIIAGRSIDTEDYITEDEISKDDYVNITWNQFHEKDVITKVEKQTGTIDAVRTDLIREVKIDDVWYYDETNEGELGDTVDYYVVNGSILALEVSDEDIAENVLVVKEVAEFDDKEDVTRVKVIFADGSEKTIQIEEVEIDKDTSYDNYDNIKGGDKDPALTAVAADTMFTYTVNDGVYSLVLASYDAGSKFEDISGVYTPKTELIGNNVAISEDAKVMVEFVKTDGTTDYDVITGKELLDWDETSITIVDGSAITKKVNGVEYIAVAYVSIDKPLPNAKDSDVYGIITQNPQTKKVNGDDVFFIDVFNGTETVELELDASSTKAKTFIKGALISYELSSDGKEAKNAEVLASEDDGPAQNATTGIFFAAVTGYDNGNIIATDKGNVVFDKEDTKFVYFENTTGEADGVITTAVEIEEDANGDDQYSDNALIVKDGSDVLAVFIDIDGEIDSDYVGYESAESKAGTGNSNTGTPAIGATQENAINALPTGVELLEFNEYADATLVNNAASILATTTKEAAQAVIDAIEYYNAKPSTERANAVNVAIANAASATALEAAVAAAETMLDKADLVVLANISIDGNDVLLTDKWTTQIELDAFNTAIDNLKSDLVAKDTDNILISTTELEDAITGYEAAKKDGKAEQADLDLATAEVELNKVLATEAVLLATYSTSTDGTDVAPTNKWVLEGVKTDLAKAFDDATAALSATDTDATAKTVKDAQTALEAAIKIYNEAAKAGTLGA